jgi:hypothetical protein
MYQEFLRLGWATKSFAKPSPPICHLPIPMFALQPALAEVRKQSAALSVSRIKRITVEPLEPVSRNDIFPTFNGVQDMENTYTLLASVYGEVTMACLPWGTTVLGTLVGLFLAQ